MIFLKTTKPRVYCKAKNQNIQDTHAVGAQLIGEEPRLALCRQLLLFCINFSTVEYFRPNWHDLTSTFWEKFFSRISARERPSEQILGVVFDPVFFQQFLQLIN